MKKLLLACSALSLFGSIQAAQAATANYDITTTWFEPDTQPRDSIFVGSFTFDDVTHTVSNLQGILSESMTGDPIAYPNDNMTWLNLTYNSLPSTQWHDATLGGTLVGVFAKNTTATFYGDTWAPQDGVVVGGTFAGYTNPFTWANAYASSVQNAYALVFVPDSLSTANTAANPLTLTWNEASSTGSLGLAHTAYADCAPGGMMGPVCMTATSADVYGGVGTMSGYPLSQTITAAVPEPETYAMLMAGLGLMSFIARRRQRV